MSELVGNTLSEHYAKRAGGRESDYEAAEPEWKAGWRGGIKRAAKKTVALFVTVYLAGASLMDESIGCSASVCAASSCKACPRSSSLYFGFE
jgi:hypothetical protein